MFIFKAGSTNSNYKFNPKLIIILKFNHSKFNPQFNPKFTVNQNLIQNLYYCKSKKFNSKFTLNYTYLKFYKLWNENLIQNLGQ